MKTNHSTSSSTFGVLLASALLMSCATGGGNTADGDCKPGYVRVMDEATKTYTCISDAEFDEVMDHLNDPLDPG